MKVIYNGAEYYLSAYLNCLKIPMVLFIIITLIWTLITVNDYEKTWKDTWLYKHWFVFGVFTALTSAYLFLVWR